MATNYPGALDTLTNPTATDAMNSATVPHATQHANLNDAMKAVQATLGTNPQGAQATVSARIAAIEGGGGATMVPLSATGDGTVGATPEAIATTAAFVLSAIKDVGFVVPFGVLTSPSGAATVTATVELVNDEAAAVASKSITQTVSISFPWDATVAGVFEDAPADTYTVRLMVSTTTGTAASRYIGGFVQH